MRTLSSDSELLLASKSNEVEIKVLCNLVNPLTTDDECTHHANLAARYQLAQFILKIGFALVKKAG